jgi:hypothetical protein
VAIVPDGMGGVSSGLPLGPYCPMKDPSSVKRPGRKILDPLFTLHGECAICMRCYIVTIYSLLILVILDIVEICKIK